MPLKLVPVRVRAADLQPRDLLRYHYEGRFEALCKVSTVDLSECLGLHWVGLQLEHPSPSRSRIAALFEADSLVEIMQEPEPIRALVRRKNSGTIAEAPKKPLIRRKQKATFENWLDTLKSTPTPADNSTTSRKGPLVRRKKV